MYSDGDEQEEFSKRLFEDYRKLLACPMRWASVEALAESLKEHKRIGGRRARQLIKDAQQELIDAGNRQEGVRKESGRS